MQKRPKFFGGRVSLSELIADTKAEDKLNWVTGTIAFWDDEKGRGYIQPLKTIDNSPYGNGQYYFEYTRLTGAEYSPKVGQEVKFRVRNTGGVTIAEIMEVL